MAGRQVIGVLHPGAMGAVVGALLVQAGHRVLWASEGRSEATARRAGEAGLTDAGTIAGLARESDIVLSVCPPHAALDVARAVAPGFHGTYVEANAISPGTAKRIAEVVTSGGARCVDGGIVGPPPESAGTTRLYLSGQGAGDVAGLFAGTALGTVVLSGGIGAASALKMTYAAWTKGSSALLLAVAEVARALGVEDALRAEWEQSQADLPERLLAAERAAATKGWRWAAEMEEIAATFAAAGQPDGFHQAAARVYGAAPHRTTGTSVSIEPLQPSDETAAEALLDVAVAGRRQLRLGEEHDVLALPGVVARDGDALAGVATYSPSGASVELAVLAVADAHRGRGVGGALVEAVVAAAADGGVATLWLVTTNDNLDALRLYQRHGFQLAEVRAGAVEVSRRRKPQIPEVGEHGIPLRDELVLVRHLGRDSPEAAS